MEVRILCRKFTPHYWFLPSTLFNPASIRYTKRHLYRQKNRVY
ncbi:MAG: hypothetical protein ACJAYV_002158 [Oleispira sp.]|jgi:hypothetical protein